MFAIISIFIEIFTKDRRDKMAKIIKLDEYEVVIAQDDHSTVRFPYELLDFTPEVGDLVEVFPDGDSAIIFKVDQPSKKQEDQISINIVNEQTNNQTQYAGYMGGKVVNKWIYFLLAFFLGGFGIHKFYSGFTGKGILYIIFSWTFIPSLIAFCTCIATLLKPADAAGNIIVTA
ncbi:hypothetical protein RV11_GL000846 [Enterococcus phoeniculicola]|nr:hypothetical protein RV11_GL000846 [Enterococcus phoeniculicola]